MHSVTSLTGSNMVYMYVMYNTIGPRVVCAPKIAFISLPINLNMCFFSAQKSRLIETVLLSTHNICFG